MEIVFDNNHHQYPGFAVLSQAGIQERETHACKEVFARRLRDSKGPDKKGAVVYFLRKEQNKKSLGTAKQQEAVLHTFERAMGIEPKATVEFISNTRQVQTYGGYNQPPIVREEKDYFLFYTVSRKWADSLPLSHILALVTRNYYPKGRRMDWQSILKWLGEQKIIEANVKTVAREIVKSGGKVNRRIQNNGINEYAAGLEAARARAAARKARYAR